jgi:hypothetical protein
MDINLKVKVKREILCKPVVCLLENEIIVGLKGQAIDLDITRRIRADEGERVIAIVFQIVGYSRPHRAIMPIGEHLKDTPEELRHTTLLTTQWNHVRAIMAHQEMEHQDWKEVCNAYYETISEVSFDQEFTKGWLINTATSAELAQGLEERIGA